MLDLDDLPEPTPPPETPKRSAGVRTLAEEALPETRDDAEDYGDDKPLRVIEGTPAQKMGTLLDLSLDKIGELLLYESVPGSKEYVDIFKTQATLATAVVGAALRSGDRSLQRETNDKLGQILDELRAMGKEFDVPALTGHLSPPETEATVAAFPSPSEASAEALAANIPAPGGLRAAAQSEELSRTLGRAPPQARGRD